MPTVPVIDQTAVGAQPFASPGVAPIRNAAPEQIQQEGQVLEQAGGSAMRIGQTIGDRIQAQVDDAKTKAAETDFLGSAQNILYDPTNGYFRQQGKNAVDQFDPAKQSLLKAGKDALDGLDNGIQKQMFQQVMQQHMLSFGKSMADYNHSQTVAWSAGESKARADSYQLLALGSIDSRYQKDDEGNAIGDFAKYKGQGENEVLNAAKLAGFDPDSAQAKSMLREWNTGLTQAMISKMLDNHDAYGAKQWFDEQTAAGSLDLRSVSTLGNAVKGEYDRQQTIDLAQTAMTHSLSDGKNPVTLAMPIAGSSINVTGFLGEDRANGRKHDGIDIAVPVGTQVLAPASGKVLKVWNDDKFGGGLSMEVQLPNGLTAGFAHLSAANVREGDTVQQGTTLGLSGKSGNATGPTLHYMMKDQDGKYVDPRQVSQPQPSKDGIADPDAAERAIQYIEASDYAPEIKKAAIAQVQTAHAQYRELQNQQQTDLYKQAGDAFYGAGENVSAIPPSIFSKLTPEQQQKFKDTQTEKALRDYSQGQQFKEMGEVDIRSYFAQNPDMLTAANVDAARPKLANSTYLQLMNKAEELKQNPKGVQDATNVNERIKFFASHSGINVAPKSTADKQTYLDLQNLVQTNIDRIKAQNNGKATAEQVDDAIKKAVIQRTVSVPRSPWNPLALFNPNRTTKLPFGAVSTGRGSDGKDHWLNAQGVDLGVVE